MKKTMKKSIFAALALVLLVGVAVILPLSSAHAVETFAIETELRQYNPAKSFGGYFMTSDDSTGGQTVYLMDMMGNVYNQWDGVKGTPKLLENGNLWSCGQIQSWDGQILWSFTPATDTNRTDSLTLHHDGRRIWNKKLKAYTNLYVAYRTATKDEVIAAGGDPNWNYSATAGAKGSTSRLTSHDILIEVDTNKNIVWEWRHLDHQVQSQNPAWPNYVKDVALAPGREDAFYANGINNDWQHINSVDYNEDLDLIVTNGRNWSQSYVIDHGKTFVSTTNWAANRAAAAGKDGDFIYRFGNPATYNQGVAPNCSTNGQQCYEGDQQLYGSHNIQWIQPYHWNRPHAEAGDTWLDPAAGYNAKALALPGAGNFIVFDNGVGNPTGYRSRIREFNPFLNAAGVNTGWFVNPPDAGYTGTLGQTRTSKQIVWSYQANAETSFYSFNTSGCQRLPNGNTSIESSAQGHAFEVTPTGEVVWEYQFPGWGTNAQTVMTDSSPNNGSGGAVKLFRHYRYSPDYPALAGKNPVSRGTITGRTPRTIGSGFTYPVPVTYYGFGFGAGGSTVGGGGSVGGGAGSGSGY